MSDRKFFRQVFTVTLYAEDQPLEWDDLGDVHHAIDTGGCVGKIAEAIDEISAKEAALGLMAAGSEPNFFGLDDDGNEEFD
jgi:hypothetical protein